MDYIQRIFRAFLGIPDPVTYQDEALVQAEDKISIKDLLRFAEKQSEQQNVIIKAVLDQAASQARTMENYIELFKPRNVQSTTLDERESNRSAVKVRESEWEGIADLNQFERLTNGGADYGVPPDPSEF